MAATATSGIPFRELMYGLTVRNVVRLCRRAVRGRLNRTESGGSDLAGIFWFRCNYRLGGA